MNRRQKFQLRKYRFLQQAIFMMLGCFVALLVGAIFGNPDVGLVAFLGVGGVRSTASTNPTLTNFARGLTQDIKSAVADFVAPRVRVPAATGKYKSFSDKQHFQVYDTARGIGGAAKRVHFEATDPTYDCRPQALEITIDDHEREAAGDADILGLQQAKTRTLVVNAVLSHEKKVIDAIKAGVSATGGIGVWTTMTNDPVKEIDSQIRAIAVETGRMPNRMLWGLTAWEKFRNNTLVINRQPGAELIGLTQLQAAAMFLNPGMQQMIGVLSYDTAKMGTTKSAANVVGDEVFIFYASPTADMYDPSFAKTFTVGEGSIESVREYRDESHRSDVLAVDWSEDIEIASAMCARRITIT